MGKSLHVAYCGHVGREEGQKEACVNVQSVGAGIWLPGLTAWKSTSLGQASFPLCLVMFLIFTYLLIHVVGGICGAQKLFLTCVMDYIGCSGHHVEPGIKLKWNTCKANALIHVLSLVKIKIKVTGQVGSIR